MRILLLIVLMMSSVVQAGTIWLDENWEVIQDKQSAHFYFRQPEQQEAGSWPITIYYYDADGHAAGSDKADKGRVRFKGYINHADFTRSEIVGEYRFNYPNGERLEVGHRDQQGFVDGVVKRYREDGTLKGEYRYQHDTLQGIQKEFFTNGKLSRFETREWGKKIGLSQNYFENGQLRSQYIYDAEGIEGLAKQFYDDGTLQSENEYRGGKRHGLSRYFSKKGQLVNSARYYQGKRQGEEKKYFGDGSLRAVTAYQKGIKVGDERIYYKSGQLQKEVSFDKKGRLLTEANYRDDGSKRRTLSNEYMGKDKRSTEIRFSKNENRMTSRVQRDTLKDWELREQFDDKGALISRVETLKRKYTGLKIDTYSYWNGGDEVTRQNFANGLKHGDFQRLNEAGEEVERGRYQQDHKVGQWWRGDKDSELTEHYDDQGRLSGERREVATDGKLLLLEHYLAGELHGQVAQYSSRGLLLKGEYVNGQREGYWQFQEDYSSELKIWQGNYRGGKQIGDWQAVSPRGYLLGQGQYDEQGRRQGRFYQFAEDGLLTDIAIYVDDEWQRDKL